MRRLASSLPSLQVLLLVVAGGSLPPLVFCYLRGFASGSAPHRWFSLLWGFLALQACLASVCPAGLNFSCCPLSTALALPVSLVCPPDVFSAVFVACGVGLATCDCCCFVLASFLHLLPCLWFAALRVGCVVGRRFARTALPACVVFSAGWCARGGALYCLPVGSLDILGVWAQLGWACRFSCRLVGTLGWRALVCLCKVPFYCCWCGALATFSLLLLAGFSRCSPFPLGAWRFAGPLPGQFFGWLVACRAALASASRQGLFILCSPGVLRVLPLATPRRDCTVPGVSV